ncbi:hypothetical protein K7T73_12760 [Bacillus badius]|uniref:hypothetical protein n=1 Tax=Bacillus badius TaxID=1455 RepID=UPI001CC117A0|nr:hypothetical protein [Bacillus badius]UAT29471.1 hypothetical protein K7T73_12760 [Bacillus badius]
MQTKSFKDNKGLILTIKNRKSAVIFESNNAPTNGSFDYLFEFDDITFNELKTYIQTTANEAWPNIAAKQCDSFGADYFEYYDRYLDGNGYLAITENGLRLSKPFAKSNKLYQFNKKKMQSFLYDLLKGECHEDVRSELQNLK